TTTTFATSRGWHACAASLCTCTSAPCGASRSRRLRNATVSAWLAEEVGELAKAVRKGSREDQSHELGDTLAWLASLANQLGISLDDAVARYDSGCPRCGVAPCVCEAAAR